MSSRLDRLFVLLENGSSSVTRIAAAKQLGEVQRLHPHELHSLLARIKLYLHSNNWDTRIAAGQAVQAVVENVPKWNPVPVESNNEVKTNTWDQGRLNFDQFDINSVLKSGTHLMGSEGFEYDLEEDLTGSCDIKEKMTKQRKLLNMKLGLDPNNKFDFDVGQFINAEDLVVTPGTSDHSQKSEQSQKSLNDIVQREITQVGGINLSSREKNRARRKARQMISKQRSVDPDLDNEEPKRKKSKMEPSLMLDDSLYLSDCVPDITGSWGDTCDWPFESFCEQLVADLFNPRWETRHGAATGLREIITCHGDGAGKVANTTRKQMEDCHNLWLEDISLRLLCVLSLDRFGDFVSDQVVAPVRETCAQVLGSVIHFMNANSVHGVVKIILQLLTQKEWEARHGGLLALKYLLAVRQDMVKDMLPVTLPSVLERLNDEVDDVGAVAAAALIPVCEQITMEMPEQVDNIVVQLWDLLLDQDELAAACNSFMGLLAAIINIPKIQKYLRPQPLTELLPRLWPFLNHGTTSVRRSTLQTLKTITTPIKIEDNSDEKSGVGRGQWSSQLLQDALRHVFQRVLIEHNHDVNDLAHEVWNNLVVNSDLSQLLLAACPWVGYWLCLAMQHPKQSFDNTLMITYKRASGNAKRRSFTLESDNSSTTCEQKFYIGGLETTNLTLREHNSVRARTRTAKMLGLLSCYVVKLPADFKYDQSSESPVECYTNVLLSHLNSKSSLQRLVAALVISEWAKLEATLVCPEILVQRLHECLKEKVYWDEIGTSFTRLLQEAKDYISTLKHYKIQLPPPHDVNVSNGVLTLDDVSRLADVALQGNKLKPKVYDLLEDRRKNIKSNINHIITEQTALSISTEATLAGAVTALRCLPEKLNPVVKPLMDSLKKEENEILQSISAEHLADLVDICVSRTPCPNTKIISNLCTFLCSDTDCTPRIFKTTPGLATAAGVESSCSSASREQDNFSGILTLLNQQMIVERSVMKRQTSVSGRGPGRPPTVTEVVNDVNTVDEELSKSNQVQRRGAVFALQSITRKSGEHLETKIPKLWSLLVEDVRDLLTNKKLDEGSAEELVSCLQLFEAVCSVVHPSLLPQVVECKKWLCMGVVNEYRAVRHMSARCLAELSVLSTNNIMLTVVEQVLPALGAIDNERKREGAVEVIACVFDKLQHRIVPYVVLLVVPLLGRMSDQNEQVRLVATQSFASLVQLLPLDGAIKDCPDLSQHKEKEKMFLQQLLNPKTIPDYVIPVPIKAELRCYQQAGVNWLGFLNKYKLHGILCDDMGLGKTLQSICILASDHHYRQLKYQASGSADCTPLPSIVICPPTLTGHWVYEVEKFLTSEYLNPLQYAGPPAERDRLRSKVKDYNLIVASYDIVRKDIDFFKTIKWNYCILDEGHIIKNGKTKASKAIKSLTANHRLILSGTPIQNNVLELWSLFDFLMPGFLSTEKQFSARYSRPILASRDPKCSTKEQEAGVLAMEALHRQVLPFLLRRMKEDVLKDLPPKITQDYYCELSPLQEKLYEDFSKSQAHHTLEDSLANHNTTHIFQALRYLQNVCNHPKLVLTPQHPEYTRLNTMLHQTDSSLDDIQHSCKLPALKQLLLDCGIGTIQTNTEALTINQHRALIFCQLKSMLNIVQRDLLEKHMPTVSYLRLDGSVPASQRHTVVAKFNNDPSIDVLLLTTQVGGLGLNLTGADTVIFVEHDWNPMKDVQAMDRAHRIGQKKVVNVYRLITRGTLEEKIMGLQKFKLMTANTVITDENSSMERMGGDQIIDLFSLDNGKTGANNSKGTSGVTGTLGTAGSSKSILESLPELWEDKEYEEEYDLSNFVTSLKK